MTDVLEKAGRRASEKQMMSATQPIQTIRPSRRGNRIKNVSLYVLGPAVFLVIWEIVGRLGVLGNGLFPPFSESMLALANWIFGVGGVSPMYAGTWFIHVGVSLERILIGFVIGTLLGLTAGALVGRSSSAARLLDPLLNALRPISVTAWIPIALLIFGIGNGPAYFLTALATFFPVYVNTVDGVRYADAKFIRAAHMLGANERQVMFQVILPAAMPSIVTGLRVAMAISWTTVVVAEALGAKSGVGYVLLDTYNQFLFTYVIAAMVTIGILGSLCDAVIRLSFKKPLRWMSMKGSSK